MTTEVTTRADGRGLSLTRLTQPFDADVRVWRSAPPLSEVHSNIPWTVIQHSPDGFECGYSGSGPADLALNILNAFVPPRAGCPISLWAAEADDDPVRMRVGAASRFAMHWHQLFKHKFITRLSREGGVIPAAAVREWIEQHKQASEAPR